MPRKNISYFDVANVLFSISKLIGGFNSWIEGQTVTSARNIHNRQILALQDQRLTNLQLDAQMKLERRNKLSNEVVMTDARAELEYQERKVALELKQLQALALRKKLEASGAFKSNFEFQL